MVKTTILMILFFGLAIAYLFFGTKSENDVTKEHPYKDVMMETEMYGDVQEPQMVNTETDTDTDTQTQMTQKTDDDINSYLMPNDYAPPEEQGLVGNFNGRNKARIGEYKKSSYNGGLRGQLGVAEWDNYFKEGNDVMGAGNGDDQTFKPMDESGNNHASFRSIKKESCGSNQNCKPEELFDVEKYLPQEVNDDWWETQPEPISVKNRHLINITKPIGINTIGNSLKNASYDIRGSMANPKFVISPWLQSSIEPDTNLKPLV